MYSFPSIGNARCSSYKIVISQYINVNLLTMIASLHQLSFDYVSSPSLTALLFLSLSSIHSWSRSCCVNVFNLITNEPNKAPTCLTSSFFMCLTDTTDFGFSLFSFVNFFHWTEKRCILFDITISTYLISRRTLTKLDRLSLMCFSLSFLTEPFSRHFFMFVDVVAHPSSSSSKSIWSTKTKIESPLVFFFCFSFFSIGDDDNKFLLRLNMTTNKWINTNIPRRKERPRRAHRPENEQGVHEPTENQVERNWLIDVLYEYALYLLGRPRSCRGFSLR